MAKGTAKPRWSAAAAALLVLTACGGGGGGGPTPAPTPAPPPAPAPPATTPAPVTVLRADLRAVFDLAEAEHDQLYPLDAQINGKAQFAARFGDYLSDAWYARLQAAAQTNLTRLQAIDRSTLNDVEKVAYDAFEFQQRRTLELFRPENLRFERGLPMNHVFGLQAIYPSFASGAGPLPFDTLADYDNNIPRTREFAAAMDATIGAFRRGAADGVFESRVTIDIVIAQLNDLLDDPVAASPFYRPVTIFPAAIGAADRTRLTNEYAAMIAGDVYPALRRLRDYLVTEYLPLARTGPGLASLAGGAAYYDFLIEYSTSLDLSADQIHQTGLDEVARILARMNAIRVADGFNGTLGQFQQTLAQRAGFVVNSREQLTNLYTNIGVQVAARLPNLFQHVPRTALAIEPYDAFREQFMFAASYQPGSPDGTRPGKFLFNGTLLGGQIAATTIYMHEGAPGHHFQISLALEDPGLPYFMKTGGLTSYVEGWALYAETLGYDMGLFNDPVVEFGHLNQQLLRALRLVVDTGLHHRGWSRQQAIDYMMGTTLFGPGIAGEVDRYIAIPGQALGYKIGELELQRLRDRGEGVLGGNFDIRRFHDQILDTGSIPLPTLAAKIERWIAAGGG